MYIKEIKYQYEDNGVSSIKLETIKGTIQGLFRAYNLLEISTWSRVNKNLNLPSPIVELTGNPSDSLTLNLIKNGIIVKYFPDVIYPYYVDQMKAALKFQLDRQFPVMSLPDYGESITDFREKLDIAHKVIADHENRDACQLMPYIKSNHEIKNFEKRLSAILNRNYRMIGIDMHGNNTTNLAYLKEVLDKWETPIWTHSSGTPKKFDAVSRASFPHVLTFYHVHSYSLMKGHGYKIPISEDIEQFDSMQLGIIPWKELPFTFGIGCNCPSHRRGGTYLTDNAKEMFDKTRIHDMHEGQTELQRGNISIKESNFERYIKSKRCARMAIFG
ncbi:MAG TPA: hypothetical protein VMT57_02660 [Candidatus Thermoplasmatota archaeon]|nr:hypothetical protein [Candidatus Thermoplasmatota archaeon]